VSDKVYTDQVIFDAIVAASRHSLTIKDAIEIDVQAFIDTFNNHRDRALCTSLKITQPKTGGSNGGNASGSGSNGAR
jgi:hypothetical protein